MRKLNVLLLVTLIGSIFLCTPQFARAISEPVVDAEFVPGFNAYGRDNSVFRASCTRFTASRTSYTNYFDLAVKNDQGASYPMKGSIRTALDPEMPNTSTLKTYTQSTYNNYAMGGNLFSRFVSDDGETVSLTVGSKYFVCIEDLANNNATGWFYTASVSGGFSIQGYPEEDVQNRFYGSFGYRMFAYSPSTPSADTTPTDTTPTSGTTTTTSTQTTTGNSSISQGSAPSSNISASIGKAGSLAAAYSPDQKAVNLTWSPSSTTTIGGYNVYRSETAGSDYKKIGDTGKSTVTFRDATVTDGKTYYYMVRAYKDTAESANSNETSALASADVAATASHDIINPETVKSDKYLLTPLVWGLLGGALLLIGLLIFLILHRRKKNTKSATPISPASNTETKTE